MRGTKLFNTYYFKNYSVIIERLNNDVNGNPRYHAYVTPIMKASDFNPSAGFSKRYTLKAYESELDLAKLAINLYETEMGLNPLKCIL